MKLISALNILAILSLTGCVSEAQKKKPEVDLLLQVQAKYKNMKTLAATLRTKDSGKSRPYSDNSEVQFKRPGSVRIRGKTEHPSEFDKNKDGSFKTQVASYDTYFSGPKPLEDEVLCGMMYITFDPESILALLFFRSDNLFTAGMKGQKQSAYKVGQVTLNHKTLANETRNGVSYRALEISVVFQKPDKNGITQRTIRLFIGADNLAHWIIIHNPKTNDWLPHKETDTQISTRSNPLLPDSEFEPHESAKTK